MTALDATLTPEFCVIFGANEGAALPLGAGPLSLGRAVENDIVLDGAAIAARHATIQLAGDRMLLEAEHPVWTDSVPVLGGVEINFDAPFRLGSCLCVVTRDPAAWFKRDISDFIVRLFQSSAASLSAPGGPSDGRDPHKMSNPEAEAVPGVANAGMTGLSLPASSAKCPLSFWRKGIEVLGSWCVHDRRRFRRVVLVAFALVFLAFPMLAWTAIDGASAWVMTEIRSLMTRSDPVASSVVEERPSRKDRQQEELEELVKLVSVDGQVTAVESPGGEFAVRGFVMSSNAYVRLLSGLSMLGFPVDMQVQNRGSQIKALELLARHTKDANLQIAADNQSGKIRVSGSLPTQLQVDEFVQQVKLELPNVTDLELAVESTNTVAKQIADRVRALGLSQVEVLRSATEVVVTGNADRSDMKRLEAALGDVLTSIPLHNRVKLYEDQDNLRLTARDLGFMAIVTGVQPVVVDRSGNRFQEGDVVKGGFRIVEININEVLVQQGAHLAAVALN